MFMPIIRISEELEKTNYNIQISNKSQIPISRSQNGNGQQLTVILISQLLMRGISVHQNNKVWNLEFGYCDLFVIWFLAIVIYWLSILIIS